MSTSAVDSMVEGSSNISITHSDAIDDRTKVARLLGLSCMRVLHLQPRSNHPALLFPAVIINAPL